ncbi:MAG: hypothetical protein R3F46_01460 [bacterium]
MPAGIHGRCWPMLLMALLLCGCASRNGSTQLELQAAPPARLSLPGPAELGQPAPEAAAQRRASKDFLEDIIQDAVEFRTDLANSRVLLDGNLLNFSSGFSPAYAIFSFDKPADERLPQAHVIWEEAPQAGNVFIGIANYQTNRWDWPAVERGGESILHDTISFPDWSAYLAPSDQRFHVAVVVVGDEFVKLRRLRAGEPYFTPFVMFPAVAVVPIQTAVSGSCLIAGSQTAALEVDFNADGVADALSENASFLYSLPGEMPVTVRSTDEDGMVATMTRSFRGLTGGWDFQQIVQPEDEETTEYFPSAAIIDGRVALAWIHDDFTTQAGETPSRRVRYLIATDASATAWLGPVDVYEDAANRPYEVSGLLDIDGRPGIFVRTETGKLHYLLGDASLPTAWSDPKTISQLLSFESGVITGMADGHPCAAYTANDPADGWISIFVRADAADGVGPWFAILVCPGIGDVGLLADGVNPPALAVHDEAGTSIAIYEAPVADGLSGGAWTLFGTVPAGFAFTGSGPLILPHTPNAENHHTLAYREAANPSLGHLRVTNNDGSYLRSTTIKADAFFDGSGPLLSFNDAFCAYDFDEEDLYFGALRVVGDDASWFFTQDPVDSAGNVGKHCSLVQLNGVPLIIYEDGTNRSIKLARMF